MSLKTTVKVGNITNLSDARYAAGMGAEMLGFCVIEGQPNFIETSVFQQIRGWVTGPKIVIQIYGINNASELLKVIENHVPDYLELTLVEYKQFRNQIDLPCIVKLEAGDLNNLPNTENIAFWLVEELSTQKLPGSSIPFMVNMASKNSLNALLQHPQVRAIALSGSQEIRPGFKEYDELAEIFEALEE